MANAGDEYWVEHLRSGKFRFTITSEAGLPREVTIQWQLRSFKNLPDALVSYRFPDTESYAKCACRALIAYLKNQDAPRGLAATPLVDFLLDFWRPDSPYAKHKAMIEKDPLSGEYIRINKRNIELYVKTYEGFKNVTVGGLTKKLLKEWMVWAAEQGASGDKINSVRQSMQVPIHDAYKNDDISNYLFQDLAAAYHEKKEKGILTPAEIEAIEKAPAGDPCNRLAVLLAARCGLRAGEVRGLQWGDIADGIITVRHNYVDDGGLKNPKRKGGLARENSRKVLVVRSVQDALEAVRKRTEHKAAGDFVIQSLRRRGEVVSRSYCKHALDQEMEAIGIKGEWKGRKKDKPKGYVNEQKKRNITFHSLRHTFVTLGRLAGLTDAEIQALAGHADGRMMENYSHVEQVIDFSAMKEKLDGFGKPSAAGG